MSVGLGIIYSDGTSITIPICNQDRAEKIWSKIAEAHELDYLGRFLPIPIDSDNLDQIIYEATVVGNEFLKILKRHDATDEEIEKERAHNKVWLDPLKALRNETGWDAMLG